MARRVYYRSSFYDYIRSLLLYVVFNNLISLIVFIDKDVYNGDNAGPYSPSDGLFLTTYWVVSIDLYVIITR